MNLSEVIKEVCGTNKKFSVIGEKYPMQYYIKDGIVGYDDLVSNFTPSSDIAKVSRLLAEYEIVKTKKEAWVNIYRPDSNESNIIIYYKSRQEADNQSTHNRISCVRIQWEE